MAKFLQVSEYSVYQGLSDSVTMLISGIDSERTLVKNVSRTSPFNIGDMDSIVGQGKSHKLHASSLTFLHPKPRNGLLETRPLLKWTYYC